MKNQNIPQRRKSQIIARAQAGGSSAIQFAGAVRFCVKNKITAAAPEKKITVAQYIASAALDAAEIGDAISMPTVKIVGYTVYPLHDEQASSESYAIARKNNPRKKNLYTGSPTMGGPAYQERVETINYKGKFKSYHGSEIYADYQSCVAITDSGRTAIIVIAQIFRRRVIAPAGTKFAVDANGILVRRLSDGLDFHPTAEMWYAKNFAAQVRTALSAAYTARVAARKLAREQARHAAIKSREIGNVRVTLEDSRRAGNCVEGSLAFAARKLGVTRQEILDGSFLFSAPASRLLAVANGDLPKVEAAINLAWTRETTISI